MANGKTIDIGENERRSSTNKKSDENQDLRNPGKDVDLNMSERE